MHTRQDFIALAGIGHHVQLIRDLAVEPELRAVAKVSGQTHRRVGGDAALFGDNALDAALWHAGVQRKAGLAYAHGLQKFFIQNFARMHGQHAVSHGVLLVIVDDFNGVGVPVFPDEAYPPLAVDADAVLSGPVSFENFQPVSGRNTQVVQRNGVVQDFELTHGNALDVRRQASDMHPLEQTLRPAVFIAQYHDNNVTLKRCYFKRIIRTGAVPVVRTANSALLASCFTWGSLD